jgi:hypothetical protein
MDLESLLSGVKSLITQHNDPQQTQYPQSNLIGAVENLFADHAQQHGTVLSSSRDPYGDPADNVKPASQDPYGDPADQ